MATFVSIQVHKRNEKVVDTLQEDCKTIGYPNFNKLLNAVLPNLSLALKAYNPKSKKIDLNLGEVTIR